MAGQIEQDAELSDFMGKANGWWTNFDNLTYDAG